MRRRRRPGFTLLELCVVMAAILILGAVFLPSIVAFRGNTQVVAAADAVRGKMSQARMKAMQEGQPYRLALSADGRRVRVSGESIELTGESMRTDGVSGPAFQAEDDFPETVTGELMEESASEAINGWRPVATFLPDGTCREEFVRVLLREPGVRPILLTLRGLTGVCTTETLPMGGL
jgi:prepilin-type N-terminal cleavage/methylation domain-containing protein